MNNIFKSLLATFAITIIMDIATYSIYPLLLFFIIYFVFEKIEIDNTLAIKLGSITFGFLAVLRMFQVNVYESELQTHSLIYGIIKLIIIFIGIFFLSGKILSFLYQQLDRMNFKKKGRLSPFKIFVISFISLVLIYLPVWLMEYPSNISPDTISQISQIIKGSYNNHHPFAHTMWLKFLMMFSDDINTSIGIAAFIQMVLNAAVFSYVIKTIYKVTKNTFISIAVLLFYGLCSFHAFYSITLIKDVTHATITLMMLTMLYNYYSNIKKKNIYLILFSGFSLLFCLFRTNGYYAFIFMALIYFIYYFKHKDNKLLISFVVVLLLATLIKGPIYNLLGVSKASFAEAISVPLQQIALVIKNGYSVDESDLAMLNKIMDISKIAENYNEFLSDPIKNLLNEGNINYLENNKIEYLKVWLNIGLRHPIVYIRAWLNQFSGYISTKYYDTSFFWSVWDNNLGIIASPLLTGKIYKIFHKLAYLQSKIPVLGVFHYPAFYTWTMLVMLFYSINKKDYKSTLAFAPLVGILLTLMISCPYNLCFRYYYAVVCCLPLMILMPIINKDGNKDE